MGRMLVRLGWPFVTIMDQRDGFLLWDNQAGATLRWERKYPCLVGWSDPHNTWLILKIQGLFNLKQESSKKKVLDNHLNSVPQEQSNWNNGVSAGTA